MYQCTGSYRYCSDENIMMLTFSGYRMTSYTTTTTKSHSTKYKYATVQVHVVYRPRDITNTKANTKVNKQELPLLPSSRPRKSSDSKHGSKSERKQQQQQQKQSRDYEIIPSEPKPRYSSGPIMSYSRFFCSYAPPPPPKPSHSSQSGPPRRKRSVRSSKPCEVEPEKKKKKKKRCSSSSTHQLRDTAPGVRFSPVVTVRTYR